MKTRINVITIMLQKYQTETLNVLASLTRMFDFFSGIQQIKYQTVKGTPSKENIDKNTNKIDWKNILESNKYSLSVQSLIKV